MRAVAPIDLPGINEMQEGFVNQGRCLQDMTGTLPPHVQMRQSVKLVVDARHQLVQRRVVAPAPCPEQAGNVLDGGSGHKSSSIGEKQCFMLQYTPIL